MKKSKKLLALVLALVMAVSILALPASAKAIDSGTMATPPITTTCPRCGGTMRVTTEWSSIWVTSDEVKCTHHTYGTDIIQTQSGIQTISCISCGTGSSGLTSRTRTVCHGYDTP